MRFGSIYGSVEVNEPVIRDLLASHALRRLGGVLQHGISGLLGITSHTTRLEHSIGTMLLVRRLGGSLEEQIAALLHDVSHTAFSHVIDFVYDTPGTQGYHEQMKEPFMASSDLPEVLARHGYDWHAFLQDEDYTLLEQPAPALCADRLDYFLRDSADLGLLRREYIPAVLEHLVVREGRIAVDNLDIARLLGYTYLAADDASWSDLTEVGLYELTAQAIRTGLQLGAIREADLWGSDDHLWRKLRRCRSRELRATLQLIGRGTRFCLDPAHPTFSVSPKVRTIDPDVCRDGTLQPLSALDPDFDRHRAEYVRAKQGPWPVRVEPADGLLPCVPAPTVHDDDPGQDEQPSQQ